MATACLPGRQIPGPDDPGLLTRLTSHPPFWSFVVGEAARPGPKFGEITIGCIISLDAVPEGESVREVARAAWQIILGLRSAEVPFYGF